jgi:uncharacterized membrane protein YedE/YeeE
MLERWFPHGTERYLAGGLLIGGAVALLFVATGLLGGQSSFFTAVWSWCSRRPFFQQEKWSSSRGWRLAYAIGLVAGGSLFVAGGGATFTTSVAWWRLLGGGLLVGFGARLGGGCTSGHGVCGLASLRLSSFVAVLTFLATAMATAHLVRAAGVAP